MGALSSASLIKLTVPFIYLINLEPRPIIPSALTRCQRLHVRCLYLFSLSSQNTVWCCLRKLTLVTCRGTGRKKNMRTTQRDVSNNKCLSSRFMCSNRITDSKERKWGNWVWNTCKRVMGCDIKFCEFSRNCNFRQMLSGIFLHCFLPIWDGQAVLPRNRCGDKEDGWICTLRHKRSLQLSCLQLRFATLCRYKCPKHTRIPGDKCSGLIYN